MKDIILETKKIVKKQNNKSSHLKSREQVKAELSDSDMNLSISDFDDSEFSWNNDD